jgi:hypothetical protein
MLRAHLFPLLTPRPCRLLTCTEILVALVDAIETKTATRDQVVDFVQRGMHDPKGSFAELVSERTQGILVASPSERRERLTEAWECLYQGGLRAAFEVPRARYEARVISRVIEEVSKLAERPRSGEQTRAVARRGSGVATQLTESAPSAGSDRAAASQPARAQKRGNKNRSTPLPEAPGRYEMRLLLRDHKHKPKRKG